MAAAHLTPAQRERIMLKNIESGLTPFFYGTGALISRKAGKNMTIDEALKYGDLDFNVLKVPGGAIVDEDSDGNMTIIPAPDQFYTLREDTQEILGSVKQRYQVLQNRAAFTWASDVLDSGEAVISAVGSIKGGAKTFVVCDLLGTGMKVDGIEEGVTPKLILMNDHAGNSAVTGAIVMERIWCCNVLNYALKNAVNTFKVRHTPGMEKRLVVQSGRDALGLVVEYSAEFEKAMAQLLKTKMSKKKVEEFVNELIPLPTGPDGKVLEFDAKGKQHRGVTVAETERLTVMDVYNNADNLNNIRGTAYGVLNAVSEAYQHRTRGRNTRADARDEAAVERVKAENRFERLIAGSGLDHRAFALLTEA